MSAWSNSSTLERDRDPNEAGQLHLAETDEVVAQDPAFMFQAFVDTNRDLGRESVSASEYRCANDRGESGINQDLAADDDEAPVKFRIIVSGISARMVNAVSTSFDSVMEVFSFIPP